MEDITLKPIQLNDIYLLDESEYANLDDNKRAELVNCSEKELLNGKYFKFFLINNCEEKIVGLLNVYEHEGKKISVAPEIFNSYKNNGYAYKSLLEVYRLLKEKGYKTLIADISENNIVSLNLHKKLDFKVVKRYINKQGRVMYYLEKEL